MKSNPDPLIAQIEKALRKLELDKIPTLEYSLKHNAKQLIFKVKVKKTRKLGFIRLI